MKKNIFILLLITTILCLSSCSGFLNDLVGFTEGSQNSWNGSNSNSSSITATVYNFTTSTGDDTYHIITWNTIGTAYYYVIYGIYDLSTPDSLLESNAITDNLIYTSFFDTTNKDLSGYNAYYQVKAYNASDELVAESEIVKGTTSFLDTIEYTYNSGTDYPHMFSWQGADNTSSYYIHYSKDYGSTWKNSDSFAETSRFFKFSDDPSEFMFEVVFYVDYEEYYSEPKSFTLSYY